MTPISDIGLEQVAATLALVAIAVAVSVWQRADLERDIGVATIRSFIQLTAIGFVIKFIFDRNDAVFVLALLVVMIAFGTYTSQRRAKAMPKPTFPVAAALTLAAATTLGLVVLLGVFKPEARFMVPVGGMVIGNAMNAASVTLSRLADDVRELRDKIEARLALGATARQAIAPFLIRSLRSGTIPLIDSTKTTGLIFFPGTMVGMLVAGADPIDAVRLQLILLYALLGSVALSSLTVAVLGYRSFFTHAQQLRELQAKGSYQQAL